MNAAIQITSELTARRRNGVLAGRLIIAFAIFLLAVTLLPTMLVAGLYCYLRIMAEDNTLYAAGFSSSGFRNVHAGMAIEELQSSLCPPLHVYPDRKLSWLEYKNAGVRFLSDDGTITSVDSLTAGVDISQFQIASEAAIWELLGKPDSQYPATGREYWAYSTQSGVGDSSCHVYRVLVDKGCACVLAKDEHYEFD